MAPALTDTLSSESSGRHLFTYDNPDPKIFPDCIKTSGQTGPDFDKIRPYDEFPKEVLEETAWKTEDFVKQPEKWSHRFSETEITELSGAADAFMASNTPLTGISKVGGRLDAHSLFHD